ncbi:MAG: triose-phosphate isomerase [Clostridia bacterium]|nr:triose-phosphate isomerase [Clostridia bacterium]
MAKLVAGNFKMNKTKKEAEDYCAELLTLLGKGYNNFLICPPYTLIECVKRSLNGRGAVGAQNVALAESGAYTGEISAKMLKDVGADSCLIGHSERRHIYGETNDDIAKKLNLVQKEGLKTILCVGETLEEHRRLKSVLESQLSVLNDKDLTNIIVAYEPVWAIGTGKVATSDDIIKAHTIIKKYVKDKFNSEISILYGGSVKPENISEILALGVVDGVLVGGASLDAKKMAQMIKSAK